MKRKDYYSNQKLVARNPVETLVQLKPKLSNSTKLCQIIDDIIPFFVNHKSFPNTVTVGFQHNMKGVDIILSKKFNPKSVKKVFSDLGYNCNVKKSSAESLAFYLST